MEPRERLRLLNLEMEMQRSWLAAYIDDKETRAAVRRSDVLLRMLASAVKTRSLWITAIGIALELWRQRKPRTGAAT